MTCKTCGGDGLISDPQSGQNVLCPKCEAIKNDKSLEQVRDAGFDHPCKDTCSGWQQGYDRGWSDHVNDVKWKEQEEEIEYEKLMKLGRELNKQSDDAVRDELAKKIIKDAIDMCDDITYPKNDELLAFLIEDVVKETWDAAMKHVRGQK